jgi:hypothetical protein
MDKLLAYSICEIPDSLYPQYQMAAGNDVLSASIKLAELSHQTSQLKQQLSDGYHLFFRNSYKPHLTTQAEGKARDALQEMRDSPVSRFESTIKPDVKGCLDTIDAFIG